MTHLIRCLRRPIFVHREITRPGEAAILHVSETTAVMNEAADEIERLRERIAALEKLNSLKPLSHDSCSMKCPDEAKGEGQ